MPASSRPVNTPGNTPKPIRPLLWDQSQAVFRALLDTLARPGTVGLLPTSEDHLPVLLPVLALADVEVTVAVVCPDSDDGHRLGHGISVATGARVCPAADAAIVTVLGGSVASVVAGARRGGALAPEDGARLVIACPEVDGCDRGGRVFGLSLHICGPGTPHQGRLVRIGGLDPGVVEAMSESNNDFPCGIDVHFVDPSGRLVSIPRSARVEIAARRG